jgi:hypothetical protein
MRKSILRAYTLNIPTARKEHRCVECSQIIKIGEKYNYHHGKFNGQYHNFKVCTNCDILRSRLEYITNGVHEIAFGGLFSAWKSCRNTASDQLHAQFINEVSSMSNTDNVVLDEEVYVSNLGEKQALQNKTKRTLVAVLPEEDHKYACRAITDRNELILWKYAIAIPEDKYRDSKPYVTNARDLLVKNPYNNDTYYLAGAAACIDFEEYCWEDGRTSKQYCRSEDGKVCDWVRFNNPKCE